MRLEALCTKEYAWMGFMRAHGDGIHSLCGCSLGWYAAGLVGARVGVVVCSTHRLMLDALYIVLCKK